MSEDEPSAPVRIYKDVKADLDKYCKERRILRPHIVSKAVRRYLDELEDE